MPFKIYKLNCQEKNPNLNRDSNLGSPDHLPIELSIRFLLQCGSFSMLGVSEVILLRFHWIFALQRIQFAMLGGFALITLFSQKIFIATCTISNCEYFKSSQVTSWYLNVLFWFPFHPWINNLPSIAIQSNSFEITCELVFPSYWERLPWLSKRTSYYIVLYWWDGYCCSM